MVGTEMGEVALVQRHAQEIEQLLHGRRHDGLHHDGDLAQQTRHKFYDIAAAEKATVVGFHFTFPSVGHVEKDGAKYRLIPSAWNPTI